MNQVNLIGRITKEISLKYTTGDNPKAYCKFNIAIDKGKDKNGNDLGADYPTISVWGKTAENLEKYCGKGSLIGVSGSIVTGKYEKDGKTVYTTDVLANRIEFLQTEKAEKKEQVSGFSQISDDDIPF